MKTKPAALKNGLTAAPSNSKIIYLNGRFVPQEEAVVSVFDHGLLYGDGVFEGIRAYNGRVFCLAEDGGTRVVKAGTTFEPLQRNALDEMCMACPAIADGSLYIRTAAALYRLQKGAAAAAANP